MAPFRAAAALWRAALLALAPLTFAPAMAAPAIDSGSVATHGGNMTNTNTVSLTTAAGGEEVILQVGANGGATTPSVLSVSGGGLTWAKRLAVTLLDTTGGPGCGFGNCEVDSEVWAAYAASAISAQTITVTFSPGQTPLSAIGIFAVSGIASSSAPFDSNLSLPVSATSATEAISSVGGLSTSQAPDMLLSFGAKPANGTYGGTLCAGWNNIFGLFYDPAGTMMNIGAFYNSVTGTQSGTTANLYTAGCGPQLAAIVFGDALAGGPAGAPVYLPLLGVGN